MTKRWLNITTHPNSNKILTNMVVNTCQYDILCVDPLPLICVLEWNAPYPPKPIDVQCLTQVSSGSAPGAIYSAVNRVFNL